MLLFYCIMKIISVIAAFTKEELKSVQLYLNSPYFNSNKTIIAVFEKIKKAYPNLDDFDIEKAYRSVTKTKTALSGNFRNFCSEFNNLICDFIAQQKSEKIKINQNICIIEYAIQKKLDFLFEAKTKETLRLLNKDDIISESHYNNLQKLYFLCASFYQSQNFLTVCDFLNKHHQALISKHVLELLLSFKMMMNISDITNYKFNFDFLTEIKNYIERNKENSTININVLAVYYSLLIEEESKKNEHDDIFFDTFFLFLQDNFNKLNESYLYLYSNALYNYCNNKIAIGYNLRKQRADIIKWKIKNKFIKNYDHDTNTHETYINKNEFIGIVILLLSENEVQEAINFIEQNKNELSPSNIEHVPKLCHAHVAFVQKNFYAVIEIVNAINANAHDIYFNSKVILLQAMYESNNFENYSKTIASALKTLANDKELPQKDKALFANALNSFNKLYKYKFNPSTPLYQKIASELNSKKFIKARLWFENKLAQIKK